MCGAEKQLRTAGFPLTVKSPRLMEPTNLEMAIVVWRMLYVGGLGYRHLTRQTRCSSEMGYKMGWRSWDGDVFAKAE